MLILIYGMWSALQNTGVPTRVWKRIVWVLGVIIFTIIFVYVFTFLFKLLPQKPSNEGGYLGDNFLPHMDLRL